MPVGIQQRRQELAYAQFMGGYDATLGYAPRPASTHRAALRCYSRGYALAGYLFQVGRA